MVPDILRHPSPGGAEHIVVIMSGNYVQRGDCAIADKFTRNEIMSSNEIRQIIGMKPSDDPKADELRNKNLNQSTEEIASSPPQQDDTEEDE